MSREEKVKWLIEAIHEIEGVVVKSAYFADYTEERLDKEVGRCEYLLGK